MSGLSVSQHSYLYSNQACNPNFEEAAFLSNPEAMEHASALKIVEFVEEDSDENALVSMNNSFIIYFFVCLFVHKFHGLNQWNYNDNGGIIE